MSAPQTNRQRRPHGLPPRPERPDRGPKARKGGPPKAKLGGPGGKTFDEMVAAGEVKPPKPTHSKSKHDRKASSSNKKQKQSFAGVELMPSTPDATSTVWDDHKESGLLAFQPGEAFNTSTPASTRAPPFPVDRKRKHGSRESTNQSAISSPLVARSLSIHSMYGEPSPRTIPLPLSPVSPNGAMSPYSQSDLIKDAVLKKTPLRYQLTKLPEISEDARPAQHADGSLGDIDDQMDAASRTSDADLTDLADVSIAIGKVESDHQGNERLFMGNESAQAGSSVGDVTLRRRQGDATFGSTISDTALDSPSHSSPMISQRRESVMDELGEETVSIATKLRPSAAVFVPLGGSTSSRSSPDIPAPAPSSIRKTSLRITAPSFVPGQGGLPSGSSTRASIKPATSAAFNPGHLSTTSLASPLSSAPKLKPTAPEFVPSFASPQIPTLPTLPQWDQRRGSLASEANSLRPWASAFVPYTPRFPEPQGQYSYPDIMGPVPTQLSARRASFPHDPSLRPTANEFVPGVANLVPQSEAEGTGLGLSLNSADHTRSETGDSTLFSHDDSVEITGLFFPRPTSSAASEADHPTAIRTEASPMGSISAPPLTSQNTGPSQASQEIKSDDGRPHRLYPPPSAQEEQNSHHPNFSPASASPRDTTTTLTGQRPSHTSARSSTSTPRVPPGLPALHSHPSLSQNVFEGLKDLRSPHPFEYESTGEDMITSTPRKMHSSLSTSHSSYDGGAEEASDPTALPLPKQTHVHDQPRPIPESPMVEDENGTLVSLVFPRPEIKIDALANDKRFREWVFPGGGVDGVGLLGHERRPSQYRRHTLPSETPEVDQSDFQGGVASTLMERVDDLRQLLGRSVDQAEDAARTRSASRQPSVEFPLRPEKKLLTVVNGDLAPPGSPLFGFEQQETMEHGRIDKVLNMIEGIHEVLVKSPALSRGGSPLSGPSDALVERIVREMEHHAGLLDSLNRSTRAVIAHNDDTQKRESVLHDALLEGQETLLDHISKGLDAQEDVRHLLGQLRASQDEVAALQTTLREAKEELGMARGAVIKAHSDRDTLSVRLARLEEESKTEKDVLKAELSDACAAIDRLSKSEHQVNGQVDQLLATNAAAESERDALANAFRTWRDKAWGYEEEIERLRQELASTSRRAEDEAKKHLSLQIINQAAVGYHEELLSRIAKLDEGLDQANGSRVKEFEAILDRNKELQGELDAARAKIDKQVGEMVEIQLVVEGDKARIGEERASLQAQLETERSLRMASDRKISELEAQLAISRKEREAALLMANERAYWARSTEVRLQTLSQENVRWRQFALESDRAKYRSYWRSNPMRDENGEPVGPVDPLVPVNTRGSDTVVASRHHSPQPKAYSANSGSTVEVTPSSANGSEQSSQLGVVRSSGEEGN